MRGRLVEAIWTPDSSIYAPPRYRKPCRYEAFVPDTLERLPALDPAVAGTISHAEASIRALNSVAQPALQPLARLLLRTESVASSKVEGMQLDARTLARAEARSDLGETVGREAVEILSNINAMQLAVEAATSAPELTLDHLLQTHAVLLADAAAQNPGEFRTVQNWIGGNDYNPCGAAFVPPPPDDLRPLLDDLISFCNDESLPALAQAGLAHAQFETIHPFADGNGRTGRALTQMLLRRRGLAPDYVPPISVVFAADKERYIRGLVAFREANENQWLESFAVSAARAADLATSYLDEVRSLQQEWRERLAALGLRSDAAAWLLVEVLPAHPIISAPVAVTATQRSRPAVQQGIDQLVAIGVLAPLSESQRNRQWEARGLLNLIADVTG